MSTNELVNPLEHLLEVANPELAALSMLASRDEKNAKQWSKNKFLCGRVVIDTCLTPDTGKWETAVSRQYFENGEWTVVEQYDSKEDAIEGHECWVKAIDRWPLRRLKDIYMEDIMKGMSR